MPKYTPRTPQLKFPAVTPDELAAVIHEELNGEYAHYEIRDITDKLGAAITKLLLQGRTVPIKGLGKFVLTTNCGRDYFDVNRKQHMHSYGSVTPKFRFTKASKESISSGIKRLLVQTLRLPADSIIEPPVKNPK